MLVGPFVYFLEIHTTDKRRRKDADNRIKAALDYATRLGLIEDDKFQEWGITGWSTADRAPYGCRLTILPFDKKEGPHMADLMSCQFP